MVNSLIIIGVNHGESASLIDQSAWLMADG